MRTLPILTASLCAFVSLPLSAAQLYRVGLTRPQQTLNALFAAVDLGPGDVVEVDGGVTYAGNIVVPAADGGSAAAPVTIRGVRVNAQRPLLSGGTNTVYFNRADHLVFEGFEVTGGSSRCILQGAHDVTVRDSVIRDCPRHGILATDQFSGSFTLENSEIYNAGAGTNSHSLYIQSDEVAYPGSVFRMRHCYVHDGHGGNLLKSRHERNEIQYNWFEGSTYHELELIGPDAETQQDGWTEDLVREDSDVVGNVIVHTNAAFGSVIRVGGDGSGQSKGRARFVNNTFLLASGTDTTVFRIFDGIQAVEMHNNVIDVLGNGVARIERSVEAVWTSGRQIRGGNNWVKQNSSFVPAEWNATLKGSAAGFVDPATRNLQLAAGSALRNAGSDTPTATPPFNLPNPTFPNPLVVPLFEPRRGLTPVAGGTARPKQAPIDIGAFESRF